MTTFVLHSTYRTDDHNVYFIPYRYIGEYPEYRDYVLHETRGILERKISLYLYDYRPDPISFIKAAKQFLYVCYDPE